MVIIDFINEIGVEMKEFEKLAIVLLNNGAKILKINKYNLTLSINFIDENSALEMNDKYRQKKYVPDVLSFPIDMNEKQALSIGNKEIGDIFICYKEAERKSLKFNHTINEEMAFLFVHGFLHLLGYDHETSKMDEEKMFQLQDEILASCNIKYSMDF